MSRAVIHTTKVIASFLLQATIEEQRAFFALLKDSPDSMQVGTAIENFKRKNPKHNTFSGYQPTHAVPFLMRTVFSPLTIRDTKDAMNELFIVKQNPSRPWPPKLVARMLMVAEQMNSDQHHYLNISEIGVAGFLAPAPKPNALVLWWDKTRNRAASYAKVRKDFCEGRGLLRFMHFPR